MLYFLFRKRKRKQHYQLHNDDINKIPERTCTKSLSQSEFEVEPSDKKVLSNEETYWANTALGDSAMQSPSIDGEALEVDGSSIISNDFESEASSYDYDWSYQSGTLTMSQLQDRFENENETKSNISVQDEEEDDSLWSFWLFWFIAYYIVPPSETPYTTLTTFSEKTKIKQVENNDSYSSEDAVDL